MGTKKRYIAKTKGLPLFPECKPDIRAESDAPRVKRQSKNAFQWKIFPVPDSGFIFFQAYNLSRTMRACPEALIPFLVHKWPVAETSYQGPGTRGHIFSYLLSGSVHDIRRLAKANDKTLSIHRLHRSLGADADSGFNICCKHTNLEGLFDFAVQMLRSDISDFCKNKPIKHPKDIKHYSLVDKVLPEPEYTRTESSPKIIVKDGKGTFSETCQIDIGIDLSKGCVSNTTASGIYDPEKKCDYCYAFQNGPCFLDSVYDIDEDSMVGWIKEKIIEQGIQDRKVVYFRLGQTVDSDVPPAMRRIPGFKDNYRITLNALVRVAEERRLHGQSIRVAMPTKVVEFDSEVADLLKRVNCSILASIGYESVEHGMVGHGYTHEKRLEEVLKFKTAGVNANVFVMTDVTRGIAELQYDAKRAVAFAEKHGLGLQFLDARITSYKIAPLIGGKEWDELKCTSQANFFTAYQGTWHKGQYLHAWKTHPDFLNIIGNNRGRIRLCSTHARPGEQRCGMCFMDRKYSS